MSISKVAKLAGVSSSTVSRVINNHPRVAPETAESVKKAMKKLGYAPSERRPGPKPASRARLANVAFLVLGSSGTRSTPGFEGLLRGVSAAALTNGLGLTFGHIPDPEHLPQNIIDLRLEGVLLHGTLPGPDVKRILQRMPTVWLMGNRRRPDWGDQVMPDSYETGNLAAQHLISRGHKELAFLNLDGSFWPFRLYYQAFAAAAGSEAGVTVRRIEQMPDPAAGYWPTHQPELLGRLVQDLLAASPRPTGLFVADDMQVAMIQPALQAAGVEIGEGKTEIISCNNERPYLVGLNPQPAVIDIRVESIGKRGIEQLIWRLDHTTVDERIVATVEPFVVKVGVSPN